MEIQQAAFYAEYIRALGWVVERIEKTYIYIKPFPIIGSLMKIQRCITLPSIPQLIPMLTKYRVRTLAIEPDERISQSTFTSWTCSVKKYVRINTNYFLPTKTIIVRLNESQQSIFERFTEAKRRGVRRAKKLGVIVQHTNDIRSFLRIKAYAAGFLGGITVHGQDRLYNAAGIEQKDILIAYNKSQKPVAGIFLLYFNKRAYYWVAGATHEGKRLFAPTLLVWEALLCAKRKGMQLLDFAGVWDERMPEKNTQWKGFTKFKEGFGVYPYYYPLAHY